MKLTESLLDELINQVLKQEEPEQDKKPTTPSKEAPPEDKETDFQELPIDIPEDPFDKKVKESKFQRIKLKQLIKRV